MAHGIFFGVGGKARKVPNLYIGVGGKARKVKAGWIGVGGKARLFYSSVMDAMSSVYASRIGTELWNDDKNTWTMYNYDATNNTSYGSADASRRTNILNNYATVSGKTLTVKALRKSDSYTGGEAAIISNAVNLTGKTRITVKYRVDGHGAQLGGYTAHDSTLYVLYGSGIPNSGKVRIESGYTIIGNSGSINSKAVGGTFEMSFNINISGSKQIMLNLTGQPCSVSRDESAAAGKVTILSVELT